MKTKHQFGKVKVSQSKQTRAPWRVWYPSDQDGRPRRVFRSFASEIDAVNFAKERDIEIQNHGTRFGDIPAEARRAYDRFRDLVPELRAVGITVTFEEMVDGALAELRRLATMSQTPVSAAVEAFLAAKRSRVGQRRIKALQSTLGRFRGEYGSAPVASITAGMVEEHLACIKGRDGGTAAPLTRNCIVRDLKAFFTFCRKQKLIAASPLEHHEKEREENGEPEAYAVVAVEKIMRLARDHQSELLPMLALQMFAGLRTSEALGLDLSVINGGAEFRLPGGKTGPRVVPVLPACRAWLEAAGRRSGPAWPARRSAFDVAVNRLLAACKVQKIKNGFRHTFISYRTAATRDLARVADECGNSPAIIKKHYRELVTSEAAELFFAILPTI